MFKKGARAPYTPLPVVVLLLRSVLRVPNNKNNGAKKVCTYKLEVLILVKRLTESHMMEGDVNISE